MLRRFRRHQNLNFEITPLRGAILMGQWVQLHLSILDKIYDLTGKLEKSQDFAEFEAKHIRFATVI